MKLFCELVNLSIMDVDGADIATPRQVYSKFCRSVKSQQNTKVLVDRTTLEKPLVKSPF